MLPVASPHVGDHRVLGAPLLVEGGEFVFGGLGVGGGVDGA